jgi:hypothetical protein
MSTYGLLLMGHFVGVILGLGAATVSDMLFMTALKDETIDETEEKLLKRASLVIWAGVALLLGTGIAMAVTTWEVFILQPRLLAHMTIAGVIVANGILVNFWLLPRLAASSRAKATDAAQVEAYRRFRRIGFISGAISFSSWWLNLLLGLGRRFAFPDLSYAELIGIYLAIEVLAVPGALLLDRITWALGQRETSAT